MLGKRIGDPCPKCTATLMRRRRSSASRGSGDVAYCAPCNSAYAIEGEELSQLSRGVAFARPLAI
jgi:hypothetical protein